MNEENYNNFPNYKIGNLDLEKFKLAKIKSEEKFRISILRMWVKTLYMIWWIAKAFLLKDDRGQALNKAKDHIHICDDQIEWYLKD